MHGIAVGQWILDACNVRFQRKKYTDKHVRALVTAVVVFSSIFHVTHKALIAHIRERN
jgi:hypothetical protein